MGNQTSKWQDFTKEEKKESVKQIVEDIRTACDQFLARLESGDIEEISEPDFLISRKFSSGSSYPVPEFGFNINFSINGLTTKNIKGDEFWPKNTIKANDEIDNGTIAETIENAVETLDATETLNATETLGADTSNETSNQNA